MENFLLKLRRKIDRYVYDNEGYNLALTSEYPEADQINGDYNSKLTDLILEVSTTISLKYVT